MSRSRYSLGLRPLHSFLSHEGGIALLEFALVFPFLFVLMIGGTEVIRLMYIQQRVEKAGYAIADVVTRYLPATNPVTAGEISESEMNNNVFPILGRIMGESSQGGFKDPTKQAVIVTSVSMSGGNMIINWQISSPGTNTDNTLTGCDAFGNCVRSIVNNAGPGGINAGVKGTAATFSGDAAATLAASPLPANENMIVTEVFFYYTPAFQSLLQNTASVTHINFYLQPRIYAKRTYFTPRNGALIYLPPTFPSP